MLKLATEGIIEYIIRIGCLSMTDTPQMGCWGKCADMVNELDRQVSVHNGHTADRMLVEVC